MAVYFAKAGRYTKVGMSADPFQRMGTVTRNGVRPSDLPRAADVELIGWIPGGALREAQLHVQFADQRVAGEWFVLEEPAVRDLIWSDPGGVDIKRMSAMAVLAAHRHHQATRDDIAAAGIRIEAADEDEAMASIARLLKAAS